MKHTLLTASALLLIFALPVAAQDTPPVDPPEASAAAEESDVSEDENLPLLGRDPKIQKLALAREMHEYRPASVQIRTALEAVSKRLSPADAATFRNAIEKTADYKELEERSIEAMADIFTLEELQAMVDYYSKPEAQSASEKFSEYQKSLQPEIVKMLDAAAMEMRTSAQSSAP